MCFPTTSVSIQIIIHWHHHALKPNLHKYLIVTIYIVAGASQRHPPAPIITNRQQSATLAAICDTCKKSVKENCARL